MIYRIGIILSLFAAITGQPAFCDDWQKLETTNFTIHFTESDSSPAKNLAVVAEKLRKSTVAAIGFDFKLKTNVYLAPDRQWFAKLQNPRTVPEWSVGTASAKNNRIVLYSPAGARKEGYQYDMVKVFHHELCHIVLGRALAGQRIPRWLNEGFAKYQAHEWSANDTFRMTIAYLMGGLIPLEELMDHWPADERRARIAYLESKAFVTYLARRGMLPYIIQRMREGMPADSAVLATTGYPIDVLEKRWKKYLGQSHTWFFMLFRRDVIWSFTALLFLFVYWRVRVRMKRKLRRMELEDELEDLPRDDITYH